MVLLCSGSGRIADGGLVQHIFEEKRQCLAGLIQAARDRLIWFFR